MSSKRDPALEIFRGIAICEVVVHHVSGFARTNTHPDTFSHLLYTVLNRGLHFAVPAFLFLMGILLTRTMLGQARSWKDFYSRRVQQTLVPYLIWSVVYALFATWHGKVPLEALASWSDWRHWLLWGKAWPHLYFLVLAIQLYLVFPFVMIALQRSRIQLTALLLLSAAAQIGLYLAHAAWIRAAYPSSLLIWHLTPVLAGVWVGIHLDDWEKIWHRFRWVAIPLLVIGCLLYVPQGVRELKGLPLHGFAYQTAFWVYTIGMAFCLLAFCRYLARSAAPLARGLQVLGAQSMQIYLIHPMLLYFWYTMPQTGSTLRYHLTVLIVIVAAVSISLLISRIAARTRLGVILFGRGDVPLAPLPARGMRRKRSTA
jgi:peptidoglycan/LPS O-acetylase OafA/YrhL